MSCLHIDVNTPIVLLPLHSTPNSAYHLIADKTNDLRMKDIQKLKFLHKEVFPRLFSLALPIVPIGDTLLHIGTFVVSSSGAIARKVCITKLNDYELFSTDRVKQEAAAIGQSAYAILAGTCVAPIGVVLPSSKAYRVLTNTQIDHQKRPDPITSAVKPL